MKIKIISGTYGHRPAGAVHPQSISAGETCDVPEGEAKRLITLGIALPVAQTPAEDVATALRPMPDSARVSPCVWLTTPWRTSPLKRARYLTSWMVISLWRA